MGRGFGKKVGTEAVKQVDPAEEYTRVGTTVSLEQMDKVLSYVEGAKKEV